MTHDELVQRLFRMEALFGALAGVLQRKGFLTEDEAAVWRNPETFPIGLDILRIVRTSTDE